MPGLSLLYSFQHQRPRKSSFVGCISRHNASCPLMDRSGMDLCSALLNLVKPGLPALMSLLQELLYLEKARSQVLVKGKSSLTYAGSSVDFAGSSYASGTLAPRVFISTFLERVHFIPSLSYVRFICKVMRRVRKPIVSAVLVSSMAKTRCK